MSQRRVCPRNVYALYILLLRACPRAYWTGDFELVIRLFDGLNLMPSMTVNSPLYRLWIALYLTKTTALGWHLNPSFSRACFKTQEIL